MASLHTAALAVLACTLASLPAHADFTISKKPTHDVSCVSGICTPTAPGANLNISELTSMLGSGDVTMKSGNGDQTTPSISIVDALTWTSTRRLTLEAKKNVLISARVAVAGTGALTIIYNEGHTGGDLLFVRRGKIDFWDLSSSLVINKKNYVLVGDIMTLAADVATKPSGAYALAADYEASVDGTYSNAPIATTFTGIWEGLGHEVKSFTILSVKEDDVASFFKSLGAGAVVRDVVFTDADVRVSRLYASAGTLALTNSGKIQSVSVSGYISGHSYTGGLVAENESGGEIVNSSVSATLFTGYKGGGLAGQNYGLISSSSFSGPLHGSQLTDCIVPRSGGLVGSNQGAIVESHATGSVNGASGYDSVRCGVHIAYAGGLAGSNGGSIVRSFASGSVTVGELAVVGGLAGSSATVTDSYFIGSVHAGGNGATVGGLLGSNSGPLSTSYSTGGASGGDADYDCPTGGLIGCGGQNQANSFWDLDTSSINDPSQGCGEPVNCPGVTGVTDEQLKSGLPAGFDPNIWGQSPNINNGYPYLLANPPPN